jgi:hypothetical protein
MFNNWARSPGPVAAERLGEAVLAEAAAGGGAAEGRGARRGCFPAAAARGARRRGTNETNSLSAGCQVSKSLSDSMRIMSLRDVVRKGRGEKWKRKLF